LEIGDGRGTGVEVLWSDTTIVIVVLMAEGNDSGRGGQAVEGAGGEVGKHHGAEAKLVAAKAARRMAKVAHPHEGTWRMRKKTAGSGGGAPRGGRCQVKDLGLAQRRRECTRGSLEELAAAAHQRQRLAQRRAPKHIERLSTMGVRGK
jgi:hypothetical protein